MAESASPYSQTGTSPLTGPSSLGSTIDPQGLQTVREIPHHKASYNDNLSMSNRAGSARQTSAASDGGSPESSSGQFDSEEYSYRCPQRLRSRGPTQAGREGWQHSEISSGKIGHGSYPRRHTAAGSVPKPASPKKEKKGGFRSTICRMFGRRSAKDRISMPNPAAYPHHVSLCHKSFRVSTRNRTQLTNTQDPEEFITSATDVKTKRSASVPTNGLLRSSGLASHPPFNPLSTPAVAASNSITPQPVRRPPERPTRPRSASVPSVIMKTHETEASENANRDVSLPDAQMQGVDTQNIGFAVTNGSNPKRRSRSVDAFRDTEHRMSPIQWRKVRRRSDEIRYWRESTDMTSLGIKSLGSPEITQKDDADPDEGDVPRSGTQAGDFNFGLPEDPMQNQERIGLEERLTILEIKLMDFEYAVSKLQAGVTSPSRQRSNPMEIDKHQDSIDSSLSLDLPEALTESSPASPRETSRTTSSTFAHETTPKPRPTSVATTLKPGSSPRKISVDRSTRSSLTGLTIEHYTTLITLIRHEQSARVRLEEEVSTLQQRLDYLSPPIASNSHAHSLSQHSHSRSTSSQQRRQGFVDAGRWGTSRLRQPRRRSSRYSTNETDTDDDTNHDVYVTPNFTPVERREYERGTFEGVLGSQEGVAF